MEAYFVWIQKPIVYTNPFEEMKGIIYPRNIDEDNDYTTLGVSRSEPPLVDPRPEKLSPPWIHKISVVTIANYDKWEFTSMMTLSWTTSQEGWFLNLTITGSVATHFIGMCPYALASSETTIISVAGSLRGCSLSGPKPKVLSGRQGTRQCRTS